MSSRTSSYRAGAASVCITPDEPLWLAGYAVRTAPARGKLSDLFASALAIEDATGNRFVIVAADLIAITPIIAELVFETARCQHGLARHQIMLAASHTHYGPEFRPDKQVFFGIPDEYAAKFSSVAAQLAAAISSAIDQAVAGLEPARLFVRSASVSFAHNRRRRGVKDGNPSAVDTVDHRVPVLDCMSDAGNRTAIVFGYACHNTTIPPDDLRYCADWAGFAREQLQHNYPSATALFVPGAGGDQDPEPAGSVELSQLHGKELADVVQRALDERGTELTAPIQSALEDVTLEVTAITPGQLAAMLASDDLPQRVKARFLSDQLARGEELMTSYLAPVQVVRFGNELLIIALSGEPVIDWAHKFMPGASNKEPQVESPRSQSTLCASSSPLVWVVGYCNDMFGYLPTRRVQTEGGYEGGRANLWSWIPGPFANDVEEKVTDAVNRLIDRAHHQPNSNA